jgi:hypothetical protein
MKKALVSLSLMIFFVMAITAQTQQDKPNLQNPGSNPKVEWATKEINLGDLHQGNPQKATFTFTNTGNVPITINNAKGTCGCTNVNWTKEPVKPGEKGFVEATYNAANAGAFTKTVTVNINDIAEGTITLTIKGNVIPKQQ